MRPITNADLNTFPPNHRKSCRRDLRYHPTFFHPSLLFLTFFTHSFSSLFYLPTSPYILTRSILLAVSPSSFLIPPFPSNVYFSSLRFRNETKRNETIPFVLGGRKRSRRRRRGREEEEEEKKKERKAEGGRGGEREKRRSYWPCASIRAISRIFQFQIRRSRHTALAPFRVFSGVYTILCAPASSTETRSCLDTCNVERDAFVCARVMWSGRTDLDEAGARASKSSRSENPLVRDRTTRFAAHRLHRSSRARARLHPFPDQCERMPAESKLKPIV